MAIYTSQYFKSLSRNNTQRLERAILNESRAQHTGFDIFLSHSFLDKEEVGGIYIELINFGFTVYVDWIVDPQLDRNNVTKSSANHVRNRMISSKSLMLAISTNSTISKWMPWELGYMDGYTKKCAIFPVSPNLSAPTSYKGVEYLSLYPFIKKTPTVAQGDKLWVIEEANKYVTFSDWLLKSQQPFMQNTDIFQF